MRHVNSYEDSSFNLGTNDFGLLNEDIDGIENFLNNNVEGDQINPEAAAFVEAILEDCDSDHEVDFDDRIILTNSFLNNIKAKFSYNKLNNNANLRSILNDFYTEAGQGGFTPNLMFKIEQLDQCDGNNNPNACTRITDYSDSSSTIEITINSDYLDDDLSILMLCKTILHESIHAAIHNASNSSDTSFSEDFEQTLQDFANDNNWQHEMMASEYVDLIAEGLEDVHDHICDEQFINFYSDNSDFDFNMFYTYLAWSGLARTDDDGDYVFDAAADFFEDPDTSTDENETVEAYNFHINAVNTNSENEVSDECND